MIVISTHRRDYYYYAPRDVDSHADHDTTLNLFCKSVHLTRFQGLHALLFLCGLFKHQSFQELLVWILHHFGSELEFNKHIVHTMQYSYCFALEKRDEHIVLLQGQLTAKPLYIVKLEKNKFATDSIVGFLSSKIC